MDSLVIFKIVATLLSLAITLYGLIKLRGSKKLIFTLMIVSFYLSAILFFPEGVLNDWFKHIPFFFGLFFFYLLLSKIVRNDENNKPSQNLAIYFASTPYWFEALTERGLQHIIVLPFTLLIWGVVSIKGSRLPQVQRSELRLWLLAGLSLTLIHVGEFVVESQGWLGFLESSIEFIEFGWYYLAMLIFFFSVRKHSQHELATTSK
jgi:hypothetical protein